MIRIKNLNKFFNKGRQNEIHVINDISLDLPEKGMVAIFGKSGCGKTTLLNVIGGLDNFSGGNLTIEEKNIRHNTDTIRNKYIGYIFQNYNLNKSESCFDNVADALRLCGLTDENEIEDRVMAALINVGMEKYSKRTPDTLSGGQQQRIAIARAIVKCPRIILADEPTGNLDEANTVMIMDLLKAIAKDHLVLLVTHESDLVDYYCDTVIKLDDGKIAEIKHNDSANGFAARDKNHIYLGELERTELSDGNAKIEYYGKKPEIPIELKIVNNGGKLYISIGTDKLQIIDEFSEIKLKEGTYEEKINERAKESNIDMSKLPPINGTRFGKLFSLKSSIKSGFTSNFKNQKKGKKLLRICMCLFAAVVVFVSSIFGSAFESIINSSNAYNHNTFYIYTPNEEVSNKLNNALHDDDNTGIDFVCLTNGYVSGDDEASFRVGSFETFEGSLYGSNVMTTNAVYLDASLAKDLKLIAGKKDGLKDNEILISSKAADNMIKKSTFGYIEERKDLIGLVSTNYIEGIQALRIAGIVESNEPVVYLPDVTMAKYVYSNVYTPSVALGTDHGFNVSDGETVLAIRVRYEDIDYPKEGDTITIQGKTLRVASVVEVVDEMIDEYDKKYWFDHMYMVSRNDYIALSKQIGKTHKSAVSDALMYTESEVIVDESGSVNLSDIDKVYYTVIHSNDPKKTSAWLEENFSGLEAPYSFYDPMITPNNVFWSIISSKIDNIISSLVTIGIVLVLMSICMYFIMRSSLMNRIKEIGIYRAIGVSKKNLTFKFFIESIVLATLSVFIGYLITSAFLYLATGMASMIADLFYYPVWLALAVLALLYAMSAFFGTLPIVTLLLKTPSQILSKYDI